MKLLLFWIGTLIKLDTGLSAALARAALLAASSPDVAG
jgi:hypothetical protein